MTRTEIATMYGWGGLIYYWSKLSNPNGSHGYGLYTTTTADNSVQPSNSGWRYDGRSLRCLAS